MLCEYDLFVLVIFWSVFFFYKQKTAYEMRISDWSSDVCSSDLRAKQKLKGYYGNISEKAFHGIYKEASRLRGDTNELLIGLLERRLDAVVYRAKFVPTVFAARQFINHGHVLVNGKKVNIGSMRLKERSEEHTSELQSLMRISYAVFCLTNKRQPHNDTPNT